MNTDIISDNIRKLINDKIITIKDYIINDFSNKYLYIKGTKK